ncbi:Set1/Ash2 histone methyltransferase complex subunit ASH2 [Entomophthora muscae]|uniref:Set1/Ash2 histone methyltransferase complex subunit ASH2 n=1 Tax=Entomophthora muscae TaxID=34485 RepID=A0ACC2SM70_9FUNG|nr:Set1/Ash2 histone methyltransferase complex subunit ASH2 [Entomophthora muscae]
MENVKGTADQLADFNSQSSDLFPGSLSSIEDDEEDKLAIQALSAPYSKSNKLVRVLATDVKREKLARRQSLKDKQDSNGPEVKKPCLNKDNPPRLLAPKNSDGQDGLFPWISKPPFKRVTLWLDMYPDHPNPKPGVPICVYANKHHSASEITVTDKLIVHNPGTYRIALSNYGATTGSFYYEVKVMELPSGANFRIGVAQTNIKAQAPLGFDGFGYSFRANPPTIFHRARPYDVKVPAKEGDVVGVLLHLPPLSDQERQEVDLRVWDRKYVYSQFSYELNKTLPSVARPQKVPCGRDGKFMASPVPLPPLKPYPFPDPHRKFNQMPLLAGSQLVFFVNGQQVGTPFSNLILGKYYPAISLFRNAKVKFNFGPNFACPPPSRWNPCEPSHSEKYGFLPISQEVLPFSSLVIPASPSIAD